MAEASLEDLNECHKVFASEVIRALNQFYCIYIDVEPISEEVEYITDGIYWAIITISYLFRKKNAKVFDSLKGGLNDEKYFHECCMLIPTKKDDRFFFNFLKRVSKIYQMAVFCYRNNDNFIETAQNCIAQFQDKEYFETAGSWQRLDRIGSFLSTWSERWRPVLIKKSIADHFRFPVHFTKPKTVETQNGMFEEPGSSEINKLTICGNNDEEGLTRNISCPIERKQESNSALIPLLADEITEIKELGSIEDEIKSIERYLATLLPSRIKKYYEEPEDPKDQNKSESPNPQTSSTRGESSSTRGESSSTRRESSSLLYEYFKIPEFCSIEKMRQFGMKFNTEEKFTRYLRSFSDEDYIRYLEYDLNYAARTGFYITYSSGYSDCDTESFSDSFFDEDDSVAAENNVPSSKSNESLNRSSKKGSVVQKNNPLRAIQTRSTVSFPAEQDSDSSSETSDEQPTLTKSMQPSSSKAVQKPNRTLNANNTRRQQRKTKRRNKRGKSNK